MTEVYLPAQPPTGKVTFLFTDIEGSTTLAQLHPETLPGALMKHNEILHNAVKNNRGFVFNIIGESFCCAFGRSGDAVNAAIEAQRGLTAEFADAVPLKVRMGIHFGEAEWSGSEYNGYVTLARSNRIMSSAYGGQIIVSSRVRDEALDEVPPSVSFRDLGERRLKDLHQPERLYQVVAAGLTEDFPPLKTLDARPNNLPLQLNRFIGREQEKNNVKEALITTSLLTIIGAGGTGKTRLALQAAAEIIDRFENGIWLIELADINQPEFVTQSIASILNVGSDGNTDPAEALRSYLREKQTLFILDNCEHLIEECAKVSQQLLSSCPGLKILATSREAIKIGGEKIFHLPSMTMPDISKDHNKDSLSKFESAQLFTDRALIANPKFEITVTNAKSVAQLCHDLDGIPLAIELAAARIRALPVEKIVERLSDRFKLLTGGKRTSMPRQQTLKALIDWSYELLNDNEKLALQRFSVFQGGWNLDAAEAVCSGEPISEFDVIDLLTNLIDKSLVKLSESEAEVRYGMLETIRQYSEAKFEETGVSNLYKKKHFGYFFELVADSEQELTSSGQKSCITKIDEDYENIREALRWSLENEPVGALKMCASLGKFWELRSYFEEGKNYFVKALANAGNAEPELIARSYYWIGFYFSFLAGQKEAIEYIEKALEIFKSQADKPGQSLCLLTLGNIALQDGEYEKMEKLTGESLRLARDSDNKQLIASILRALGTGKLYQNLLDESRVYTAESLAILTELGDKVHLAKIINNYGALEYLTENYSKAVDHWQESLALREELGDRHGMAMSFTNLGSAFSMMQEFDRSEEALRRSHDLYRQLGDIRMSVSPLNTMGNIANDTGNHIKAFGIFRESIRIAHEVGERYFFMKGIEGIANSYIGMKDFEMGCRFSAMYMKMMLALNINVTNLELERMEGIKSVLKDNLDESGYQKLWDEGESLSQEEAVKIVTDDPRAGDSGVSPAGNV